MSIGTGALINVEAALAGIEVAQRIDAHSAAAEKTGQGPCVVEVAVEAATKVTSNGCAFWVDFGHHHCLTTAGKGPSEQYTDVATIGLGKPAAVSASTNSIGRREIVAGAVDLGEAIVRFDGEFPLQYDSYARNIR